MTDEQLKSAGHAVLRELTRRTQDPAEMLVVLGSVISAIARASKDPVDCASSMIEGLEGWIRLYQAEQGAGADWQERVLAAADEIDRERSAVPEPIDHFDRGDTQDLPEDR